MIEELLPRPVVAVEAYGEEGAREFENARLHPEEAVVVARAVAGRRREFTLVRACARRAMETLGVPPQPVLPGVRGAPRWPTSLTGSMTHCDGYRAAALARTTDLASVGIDAEPSRELPDELLSPISLPTEAVRLRRMAADRPGVHWDRLLFSAKEAVYKAWFPLTGRWLAFGEVDVEIDTGPDGCPHGAFRARLLVPGPVVGGHRLERFEGRWTVQRGLVMTAVTVPHV